MTEDAIFKEQWNLLKKEMAMGDAHLQQRLEQFIFRQYGRAVLTHYIKALSVLELSRHFYLRFRRRSRAVTEPILYWTVLAETTIHMTLEGVKDMHPFISLPARAGATFQLDMLKDCYLLYLRDRGYPCWPRASRRSRIIRNKWNAPELEAAYFLRLCQNSTDRHYANVMNILLDLAPTAAFLDLRRAEVGSHHHHAVLEVHGTALAVGQATILQHLQQNVEHIRVSLLDLVHENH